MKAFLAAIIAMVLLALGASVVLNEAGFSSAERFSGANVRLSE